MAESEKKLGLLKKDKDDIDKVNQDVANLADNPDLISEDGKINQQKVDETMEKLRETLGGTFYIKTIQKLLNL